ncbi:MAG: group II intron reverse transcriptase/maturase [Gammaproteobacteria bacterium]
MTAMVTAGATSLEASDWHAIDWRQVHQTVRRLQARIVKAVQEGRWGKVRALQHLLTHSFSGKALAVRRVTENRGKRTPGVDGITWNTPDEKVTAIGLLRQRGYRPSPLRRVYILKSDGKRRRPLSIPTLRDRAMQALYLLALDPIAETMADANSYGFRTHRAPADAIEQCFNVLAKKASPQWVLEGDIRACFDEISHSWLLAHIPMDQTLLRKWLKAGFMEKHVLYPTEAGTPQGAICSPVMANMALDGLEARLRKAFPRYVWNGGQSVCPKVNLCRFADDFVITGATKSLLENEVKPLVETFLRERGLELSPEKTMISHIDDGFDFLGQNLRKYQGKLLIKPASKSVKAFLRKVRHVIKQNKSASAGTLICQLNPIIRGWTMYHRHAVSSTVFQSVDHAIFQALWRWAKRRHLNKGQRWVKARYFHSIGDRNWVFTGEVRGPKGEPSAVHLFAAHSVRITRHVKVNGKVNPYDPDWELYLEKRQTRTMAASMRGRNALLSLWKRQQGRCPRCGEAITPETGWHKHHIVYRSHGGSDTLDNQVLLHPVCHRQLHFGNDSHG